MILILSKSELETSTDDVLIWLKKLGANFIRLNGKDLIDYFEFQIEDGKPVFWVKDLINDRLVCSEEIKTVWYRRKIHSIADKVCNTEADDIVSYENRLMINHYHHGELFGIYEIIEFILKDKFWINRPMQTLNKVSVLIKAESLGIKIPNTFINNKAPIPTNKFITKPIKEVVTFKDKNYYYPMFTVEPVESESFFFPSLFQEKIEKQYEVRSFFLDGEFYSIAIFSQQSSNTKIDYRNIFNKDEGEYSVYNNCSYKVPLELETKMIKLMNNLNLKSGSIDLIRGVDGEYYFLEVNPVGQFGNVSDTGRFNLEKKIAEKLIYYDRKEK